MPAYREDLALDEAIRVVFADADSAGARAALAACAGDQPERVQLAVVLLSEGRFDRLSHFASQAALDARDVLYWAFYYDDEPPARLKHLLRPEAPDR